jgi:hypothetical protein
MVTHPIETASGIYAMAEHVPIMGGLVPNPLKFLHAGTDIIFNGADPKTRLETVIDPVKSLQDDGKFGQALVDGFIEPYKKSWSEGKYFEVAGRATFDIGSLFIGAGEANAAIKTGEVASVASKTAEVANVSGKAGEVANVASKSGKAAEVASTAGKVTEGTNVASKASKTSEVASTTGKATETASDVRKASEAASLTEKTEKGAEVASKTRKTAKSLRASGGQRRSPREVLTPEEISKLTEDFKELGGDPEMLRFNKGRHTGYSDDLDKISVRGDVNPLEGEGITHPRSTMTPKAVLAHELGHQAHRGTKVPINAWNDEFRASYWAAKNLPNLTLEERASLIQDAILRAQEANVPIKNNAFMRKILYGYE